MLQLGNRAKDGTRTVDGGGDGGDMEGYGKEGMGRVKD